MILAEIVEEASIGETTETALVRWDDEGTVVASPKWISSSATSTVSVFDEDLGIGLDKETFEQIKSLVDFTQPWDSLEARGEFEGNLFRVGGKMLSAFPIPEPPFEYDPDYFPEFMVVSSIEVDEVFDAVNRMDAAVSASVSELIRDTLIVGFVGMAIIVVVIFIVGSYLTHPLKQINRIGSMIIDTFGDHNQAINVEEREFWCNPRTEISELAREFRTMVMNFSGSGTARIVKQKFTEVLNPFTLFGEFKELYERYVRCENCFLYDVVTFISMDLNRINMYTVAHIRYFACSCPHTQQNIRQPPRRILPLRLQRTR